MWGRNGPTRGYATLWSSKKLVTGPLLIHTRDNTLNSQLKINIDCG